MTNKNIIAGLLVAAFVVGSGVIVYRGRPVMKLNNQAIQPVASQAPAAPVYRGDDGAKNDDGSPAAVIPAVTTKTPTPPKATPQPPAAKPVGNIFAMSDVQNHSSPSSCWSAINGSVYDLTTWINRHPGGARPIESLCGADGSLGFNAQHGGSGRAQAALFLLKIGSLK